MGLSAFPFSGEGSISVPSPVKEINLEKQGRAQEQSALCAAHVTGIGYRPALRYPTSNSIPSPVSEFRPRNRRSFPMMMRTMSGK